MSWNQDKSDSKESAMSNTVQRSGKTKTETNPWHLTTGSSLDLEKSSASRVESQTRVGES